MRSTRCPGSNRAASRVPVARPITCMAQRNGPVSPRTTVQPVAPSTSVAWPTASPHAANDVVIERRRSILEPLGHRDLLLRAGLALLHPTHVADLADERAALHAGIALRGALLLAAGAADHPVVLV